MRAEYSLGGECYVLLFDFLQTFLYFFHDD